MFFACRQIDSTKIQINTIMKKSFVLLTLMLLAVASYAQRPKKGLPNATTIQMTPSQWAYPEGQVEFISHAGVPSMKISQGNARVAVKGVDFSNGTIEYDIQPQDDRFTGVHFRMLDEKESEYFYLRSSRMGNPNAIDAIQYAAFNKGVNLWDLLPHFQTSADIRKDQWNHIKLVVSGRQMLVYVNDMSRPALEIPRLEGNTSSGSIAFTGSSIIANVVIRPGEVTGLPDAEGFDPTRHDTRYVGAWVVTEPAPLPRGRELFEGDFPTAQSSWEPINTERRGLINLTRKFGASESRRFTWLRTKLTVGSEIRRRIYLGYSDEIWVYINRQLYFADKNLYVSGAMRRVPDGRISVENGHCEIVLKPGDNELLIGVANDFFGWGLIARLESMDGIQVSTTFPLPAVPSADLNTFTGVYSTPGSTEKITITSEGKILKGHSTGQSTVELEYVKGNTFRYAAANLEVDFEPANKKMILRQGTSIVTYTRE
jgi:hypothetical protein